MIQQLRIYEIFEHNKQAFHDRFRDHAWRIMKRYGFRVRAFWESQTPGRTEFVYLLDWDSREQLAQSWEAFLADEEWREIKRITAAEHGDLVGDIEDRTLVATDYSPSLTSSGGG